MLSLGMWLRKTEFNPSSWKLFVTYAFSSIVIFITQKKINSYNYDFIFNVTAATSLFLLFNKFKIQNKPINFAAKSCFAIFCIHTGTFANTVWQRYFITVVHIQSGVWLAILWMFLSVGAMFISCLAISFIMRSFFGKIRFFIESKFPMVQIEK